ncbi:MAG: ABC transporter permease [Candidatus Rokubacteria bacterium]|nr:ABC transporter permease [Candidatus Rokubacteria bacterium]MBI3104374.1 ABC transporter permease [Candidatus Rokubacteria bacterium]
MLGYLAWRSLHSLLLLWLVTVVVFGLLHLTPGDPASLMLGEQATPEQIRDLRHALGLDEPLVTQYAWFLAHAVRGDFGASIRAQRPALEVVLERLPATLLLTAGAFIFALCVGLPIGVISAVKRLSLWDHGSMALALMGQSMPVFWLGLMLIVVFSVHLRWLPVSGAGGPEHLVLPAVTLGTFLIGLIIRLTRSSMLDVLGQDYVRTARAKGLAERAVIVRHALRNALIPVVTLLGLQLGMLLGGAVITETVFAWPGVGMVTVTAIYQHDYPVVQCAVFISAVLVVSINWAVDVLYHVLDPRIRASD